MNFRRCLFLSMVVVLSWTNLGAADDAAAVFQSRVAPLLNTYCAKCHGAGKQTAKINFAVPRNLEQLAAERTLWFRVVDQIESGEMPPDNEKQPSPAERDAIVAWVRNDFTTMLIAKQRAEGRSKLRRLTRNEYTNTIYDLFGVRPTVGLNLPDDGRVEGYDKVSAALPLSASGAGGYIKMSEDLLNWVLKPVAKPTTPPQSKPVIHSVAVESEQSKGHILELADGWRVSFNSDTTSCPNRGFSTNRPGLHRLRITAYGYQTNKPMAFGVYAGHTSAYPQVIDLLAVLEAPPGKSAVIETEVYLRSRDLNDRTPVGDALRVIPLGIGVQVPKNTQATDCKGPGLAFLGIDVEEPDLPILGDRWLTADFPSALNDELRSTRHDPIPLSKSKATTQPEFLAILRATFQRIGARLYRRDLTPAELDQLLADVVQRLEAGAPLQTVFLEKVTEMMTSPEFLCVIEPPGQLSDFALASRLSYFLWNSTPDEMLLELARQGKLRTPQVLREQTERLLNDPKSDRFITDFVNQWLGLRALDDTTPDRNLYPEYDDYLKISSARETAGFFRTMLAENISVRNFVASPWVYINDRLAQHYGLPEVAGTHLRKVNLPPDSPYGGLWTQAAVMKVTANGTNTSPVKRGVWVSERLLGIRIPPPPPNISPVEPDVRGAKTLREQLALHRGAGSCASCHARFDPYGFALESFDVAGGFRQSYREVDPEVVALPGHQRQGRVTWRNGLPVDCSGETPTGEKFADVRELRRILNNNPEQLARGVTRHLLTYATGTPASDLDQPALDRMVKNAGPEFGLRSLLHALVQSELFGSK